MENPLQIAIFIVLTLLKNVDSIEYDNQDDTPPSEYPENWSLLNTNTTSTPKFYPTTTVESEEIDQASDPKVLFAQGKYMMISYPNRKDCTDFQFTEKSGGSESIPKLCTGSERLDWWWVYDFAPASDNNVHVRDIGHAELFYSQFSSLPEKPPNLNYMQVTSGAGWISASMKVDEENLPNLVGVEVLYKAPEDDFWWRSYVETVSYSKDYPYVRPSHYCTVFRTDGTLCLLMSDGVEPMSVDQTSKNYTLMFTSFRIQPFNRSFGQPFKTRYVYDYCDWEVKDCYPSLTGDPEESKEEGEEEEYDDDDDEETTVKENRTTTEHFVISTTITPEWLYANLSEEAQPPVVFNKDDLWLIFLALFIILCSILIPLAVLLGTRAGYSRAERQWAMMGSSAGNVNIPLGYVSPEWKDSSSPPK